MSNLAKFTIEGTASSPGGYDGTVGQTVHFALEGGPASLVNRWTLQVYDGGADPSAPQSSAGAPLLSLVGATTGQNVDATTPATQITCVLPSGMNSWIVRSKVNGGLDATGKANPDYVFERMLVVRDGSGRRRIVVQEQTQYNGHGWEQAVNDHLSAIPASVTSGTELGHELKWNGSIYIPKRGWVIIDYPAGGDGTTEINAALANRDGVCVEIAEGVGPTITGQIVMARPGAALVGRGQYGSSTITLNTTGNPDHIVLSAQHQRVEGIRFLANRVYTAGFVIRCQAAYNPHVERLCIHNAGNAILFASSIVGTFRDIEMAFLNGSAGIQMIGGGSSSYAHALSIQGHTYGYSDYPLGGPVGFVTNWAGSTAYVAGNVVGNNNLYFQCITPGTSAGSGGPSAIPAGDPITARATLITDGTAQWKYVGGQLSWLVQSEYTATFAVSGQARFQQGLRALWMANGTGNSANDPQFCFVKGIEADHNISSGIFIQQGQDIELSRPWVSSVGATNGGDAGIVVSSAVIGPTQIVGGRVFGVGRHAVQLDGGNLDISNLRVGNWGLLTNNTYDGFAVAANQTDFSITNCVTEQSSAGVGRDGVRINTGCNRYNVSGIRSKNLAGSPVNDLATGATRYVAGNI